MMAANKIEVIMRISQAILRWQRALEADRAGYPVRALEAYPLRQ
jgi:hypothetical protein